MRRLFALSLLVATALAHAADEDVNLRSKKAAKADKDAELTKKSTSVAPDKSLAGDITRKKTNQGQAAPALQYDQFRLDVEQQVASKRGDLIKDLLKIISLTPKDSAEAPDLYFRLGELYWEESKFYFFQANRKDDDRINAMNRADKEGEQRAIKEKEELQEQSKDFSSKAIEQYSTIVQSYKSYKRTDEVLYFLGKNLMEQGEDHKALVAYKRLIDKYPKSKYIPDAYFAFGEFYFDTSKGRREQLEKALDNYVSADKYPENQVYGFALYKQGWCQFNLGDYHKAMDMFRAVVLYAQLAGDAAVEKDASKPAGKKGTLAREARNDFVRAFERALDLGPGDAKAEFAKLSDKADDRFLMMKQLANLYYEDGKDKEAALSYNMLIKEKPLSPEAPGFQAKIVDCVLRAGNKKMTLQQVRQLVKVIQEVEKSGNVKDEKDKKALSEARELSERTLSNLAVNWHNEAKKTRDDDTFGLASEVYSDYLTLFPDSPKAYDLRFFWAELLNDNLQKYEPAAEQYTRVLLQDVKKIEDGDKKEDGSVKKPGKPGKFMVNAAYNAILAYDEVVKAAESAGKLKAEAATDPNKKLKIPPEKQNLLDACERYLKYVEKGDKRVEIAFKAANIYYRHNYLDDAVKRFADIALNHPEYKFENGDRAGEISANLILDSYNLLQDYDKVLEWATKFYAEPKLANGKFKEELKKIIETVTFKRANQLDSRKEYARAVDAYLEFVAKFPESELADKAMHNAISDLFQAKQLDKAFDLCKRLIREYGKSEHVPACVFSNASYEEAVAEFEEAARYYEQYASAYEKGLSGKGRTAKAPTHSGKKGKGKERESPEDHGAQIYDEAKAQIALFNAGVFRDALGEYKKALGDRERFLELWPEAQDFEKVFLSIADLEEKNGQYAKAQKQLEEYEKKYQKDSNKILTAEGRIADLYDKKMQRGREALRIFERILKYYDSLPQRTKKGLDDVALEAVGRAHYALSEDDWKKYNAIKLRWTKLTALNELKATIKEKAKGLEAVQKRYTQTVTFKAGGPAICALYRIGSAYDHFSDALVKVQMPRGVPPELEDEIRQQFTAQAEAPKAKAAEAFAAAVQKSRELDIFNECSEKSLAELRETYAPDKYPPMQEDKLEVKLSFPVASHAQGEDLLEEVQAIPVPQSADTRIASKSSKDTREVEAPAKDSDNPDKDQLDPAPDPRPPPEKAQAPSKGEKTPKKKGTEEPEEPL